MCLPILTYSLVDSSLQQSIFQEYVANMPLQIDSIDLFDLFLLLVLDSVNMFLFLNLAQRGELFTQV